MEYNGELMHKESSTFLSRVFQWMAAALLITGCIAYIGVFVAPFNTYLISYYRILFPIALIGQLLLVMLMSFLLDRINYGTALGAFLLYAVLMGITMSSIFFVYTTTSIISTFFIAAGMFGAMALYGAWTKYDLSRLGSLLYMALIGVIIALLLNLFIRSAAFDTVLSIVGVFIFTGLTAVSMQQLKHLQAQLRMQGETSSKIALMGALTMYLNFINLFLNLLQVIGSRKDQ